MKLVWSDTALRDRDRIMSIIALDSPTAALKLDETFERAAQGLLSFPLKGHGGRIPATRELVVHPNYLLIYRVEGETVHIVTVLHTAQRWP